MSIARWSKSARSPAAVLAILVVVAALFAAVLFVGHGVRKRAMVRDALVDGREAYERGDWETARLMLSRYLTVNPDDPEVLPMFAETQLATRPLGPADISNAIKAYRRVLRAQPAHDQAFNRLALLYEMTGNWGELTFIARKRQEAIPNDPQAVITLGKALSYQHESGEARAVLESFVQAQAEAEQRVPEYVQACLLLSTLTDESGRRQTGPAALRWVDQALEAEPDSALALVQRAGLKREMARDAAAQEREELLASVREDLTRAARGASDDPRVLLMLSEQWMALGQFDRAAEQLAVADEVAPENLTEYFADPDDWVAARYIQAAKLAFLRRAFDEGADLALATLEQLAGRPQRTLILPVSVELLVAAGRLPEARRSLQEYVDAIGPHEGAPIHGDRAAVLEALVASAAGDYYRVIELLEPMVDGPDAQPRIVTMLAEACAHTGQTGRAVKAVSRAAVASAYHPDLALALARAHVAEGAWAEARAALLTLPAGEGEPLDAAVLRLGAEVALAMELEPRDASRALESALGELTALREAHPRRFEIRLLIAAVAEHQGRVDDAEKVLTDSLRECDDKLGVMLALGRLYAGDQQYADALKAFRAACDEYPNEPEPWLMLSDTLIRQQDAGQATAELRRGLNTATSEECVRVLGIRLATLELVHGDRSAGVQALQAMADADPGDIEVLTLLLGLSEVVTDGARASELLGRMKQAEGDRGLQWRIHQAQLLLADVDWRGQRAEIEELLKYCIDAAPTWTTPHLLLGELYERVGEPSQAEAIYSNGFNLTGAPSLADRWLALLQRQGRYADARDLLAELNRELAPRWVGARRVGLALRSGEYEDAINELQMRVADRSGEPMELLLLARLVHRTRGDVDRALEYLDQAAALAPDLMAVMATRVAIMLEEQRADEAAAALDELVATTPTVEAYLLRAAFHAEIGAVEEAEQDYIELSETTQDSVGAALLGDFYAAGGRFDEAIAVWETGLEKYPDAGEIKRGMAKALITRGGPGDRPRARAFIDELTEATPDDTELLWMRVADLATDVSAGSADQARTLLREALGSRPATAEIYRRLVALAFSLGDPAAARDLAKRGQQTNPRDLSLLLLQAQAELMLENLDAAGQLARAALVTNAFSLPAHQILVEVAVRQQDLASLRQSANAIQRLADDAAADESWQILRAGVLAALDRTSDAIAALEEFRGSEAGRASVPVLLRLQELHLVSGDMTVARECLEAAAALAPGDGRVLGAQIRMLGYEGRFDDIVALMSSVASDERRDPGLDVFAARTLAASAAHRDRAIELVEHAIRVSPNFAAGHMALAEISYLGGDVARAVSAYEDVLARHPMHAEALNNLAWILTTDRGDHQQALVYARQAVTRRPTDAEFRDTLGTTLRNADDVSAARDEFRRSVDLAPAGSATRARSLLHLAQASRDLGDLAPIARYLSDALATHESHPLFSEEELRQIDALMQAAKDGSD